MFIGSITNKRVVIAVLSSCLLGSVALLYGRFAPPRVTGVTIREGTMEITFNRRPDTASVEGGFALSPSVPGRFLWQGNHAYFIPRIPFPNGQDIRVRISSIHEGEGPIGSYDGIIALPPQVPVFIRQSTLYRGEDSIDEGVVGFDTTQNGILYWQEHALKFYSTACRCTESLIGEEQGLMVRDATVSSDGRYVLIDQQRATSREEHQRLWLFDRERNSHAAFWYESAYPDAMWSTPEGSGVILLEGRRMTFVPFIPGKGEVTFLGVYDDLLSMSADGGTLVFATKTENAGLEVSIMRFDQPEEKLMFSDKIIEQAIISPDGMTLYLLTRPKNTVDDPTVPRSLVAYLFFNQGEETLLQDQTITITSMSLSDDGNNIALITHPSVSGREEETILRVYNTYTQQVRELHQLSGIKQVDWSSG